MTSLTSLDLSHLNPEQHEAVCWPGGPMQIFAGAGSGKTRVITYRIAKLIEQGTAAHRILAVTFTNKASRELKERLEVLVGHKIKQVWTGTFHSICARMLRIDGEILGLDPNFVVYDDSDQLGIIKEILKQKNIDEKSLTPRSILSTIGGAKEKFLSPERYEARAHGFFEEKVAEIYPIYNRYLKQANALDFNDLLFYGAILLEEDSAREKYQEQFQHVLIDEYQDVNFVQYQFAQLVSGKHKNLTIVGDDDQSIYGWRGADLSLMLRFSSDNPSAKVITLNQNYRSTQSILSAAHHVIQHNLTRSPKQMWTKNEKGKSICLAELDTEQEEALYIAEKILHSVRSGERKFGDFAILYRANTQSRVIEEVFLTMRIPHILVGGQRFYERKEVKDMLAYLRLVLNPHDNAAFRRVINVPTRGIGTTTIANLNQWSAEQGVSLWTAIQTIEALSQFSKRIQANLLNFSHILSTARNLLENSSVSNIYSHLLEHTGYVAELRQENTEDSKNRLENLKELLAVTEQYDSTVESPSLTGFLENVALISDVDSLNEGGEAATLMTLHASKGLEFPVVYIVGMEEGIFPHSRSLNNESEIEEERRLCYVGMTRAREELTLLHARRRSLYGQPNFNERSRFIGDIPTDLLEIKGNRATKQSNYHQERNGSYRQNNTPHYIKKEVSAPFIQQGWTPLFTTGQKVSHSKFGIGIVLACQPLKNDVEVTVAFPGVTGVKKLIQSFAKLESIS